MGTASPRMPGVKAETAASIPFSLGGSLEFCSMSRLATAFSV
jgi:hypothetical protein